MTAWWEREPGRVLLEDDALRALVARGGLLAAYTWECAAETGVRIQATLTPGAREQRVELRFPAHYPQECPSVRPVPYGTRLSDHQFVGDGVLCLEIGPDNWHPRHTAADMLESAWRLLMHETIAAVEPWVIPSRHVPHVGELVRQHPWVLILPADFKARLPTLPERGELAQQIVIDEGLQVWPIELPAGSPLVGVPAAVRRLKPTVGRFLRVGEDVPRDLPTDRQAFADLLLAKADHQLGEQVGLLLLIWPDGFARGYLVAAGILKALVDVPLDDGDSRLPARTETLASTLHVGIVGLGSLGSKVAVSLARSGVRRFLLVDGDVLAGTNIGRHAGRYDQAGRMKVDVVASLLREVARTDVECVTLPFMLGSALNPESHEAFLEALGKVDVIVDATADAETFNTLAMLASRARIPFVWGEVFAGGLGGLVGAAHPARTPCPQCVRAGFLARAEEWPPAPRSKVLRPYESGGDASLAATDADVGFVAAAVTARVFEAADAAADPATPVVLLGLRRGWIFERVFDTVHVDVLADDWSCAWCWREPAAPDAKALSRALAILGREGAGADDPHRG